MTLKSQTDKAKEKAGGPHLLCLTPSHPVIYSLEEMTFSLF
jgi:hypothetical protein